MKVPKIIEAARAMALENLVPPEITIVTRDNKGHIQLWWHTGKDSPTVETQDSPTAETQAKKMYDLLALSKSGHWLVARGMEGRVKMKSLGQDIVYDKAVCRRFSVLERRMDTTLANMDEREFAASTFVSGILKQIFDGTYNKPVVEPSVTVDPYEIKTQYVVDSLTFNTLLAAEEHVKGIQLFDIILKDEPGADFLNYQAAIETFLKNSEKVISILKGKL